MGRDASDEPVSRDVHVRLSRGVAGSMSPKDPMTAGTCPVALIPPRLEKKGRRRRQRRKIEGRAERSDELESS